MFSKAIFDNELTPLWRTFLALKELLNTKYNGSPTRVTRSKVASNMADAISIRHSDSTLNSKLLILSKSAIRYIKHEDLG